MHVISATSLLHNINSLLSISYSSCSYSYSLSLLVHFSFVYHSAIPSTD